MSSSLCIAPQRTSIFSTYAEGLKKPNKENITGKNETKKLNDLNSPNS
jgi:hypothetical protein